MNGNGPVEKMLLDHETRITRLEEAVSHIQQALVRIEAEQKALRESVERNMQALREEFHRDRRFSAMVFLTTQLAVIGALLRLAGIL